LRLQTSSSKTSLHLEKGNPMNIQLQLTRPAVCLTLLLAGLAPAQSATTSESLNYAVEPVVSFDQSKYELPEGIAVDKEGNLYVGLVRLGVIKKITPSGEVSDFAAVNPGIWSDLGGGIYGLAFDQNGILYAGLYSGVEETHGVWRIMPDGQSERFFALPTSSIPNEIAFDEGNNLFVTDSSQGAVWRVTPEGEGGIWLQHPLLAPPTDAAFPLGANGIAFWDGDLYVGNTYGVRLVKVPVLAAGAAGEPEVYLENFHTDGFKFDSAGNLYATTGETGSEIVRVSQDRNIEVLAVGLAQGLDYPTNLYFGQLDSDNTYVYIANFSRDAYGDQPGIVRIDVGVAGQPLP
jgi:sugar lactone lactonase YvrE